MIAPTAPMVFRTCSQALGTVAQIDGRRLTLESGLILDLPPTLGLGLLRTGTRVKTLYELHEGGNAGTGIVRI